ncbi:MAG: hypothetical protein V4662_11150 [Verrucomicrobiota bacterium]
MDMPSPQTEPQVPKQTVSASQAAQLLLLLLICGGLGATYLKQKKMSEERAADQASLARLESLASELKRELLSNNQAQTEILLQLDKAGEKRLENLAAQVTAKPQVQALRWAYLNQFEVRDAAKRAVKSGQLKAEDDPEVNPELAKILAEYNGLQEKLSRSQMPFHPSRGGPPEIGGVRAAGKDNDPESWRLRMAELRVSLAPYLTKQSGRQDDEKTVTESAIRKVVQGKYDLVIDKTFGDHQILFKTSQPIPDITNEVVEALATMAQNK